MAGFSFHLMWCMYLDEQFSKVKELFEELEGMKQLLKVKYFKYGWSLYYNKAALILHGSFLSPVACCYGMLA